MEPSGVKTIWCESCHRGAWRHVCGLLWKGMITTRSGRLKVPVPCHACEEALAVGTLVEAVTINVGEREAEEWMRRRVVLEGEEGVVEREGA